VRHIETTITDTSGSSGSSQAVQRSLQERSLFQSAFFMELPFPEVGGPYVSVNSVPSIPETLISRRPFETVLSWKKASDENFPSVEPKDDLDDQTLLPWTEQEKRLFCSIPATEQPAAEQKTRIPRDRNPDWNKS
jgi:hypothetical protein